MTTVEIENIVVITYFRPPVSTIRTAPINMTSRIDALKNFMATCPEDPFYPYAIAMELRNSNPSQSLALLESVVSNFPDYLPSYFQLANLYLDQQKTEAAVQILETGITLATKQSDRKTMAELKQLLTSIHEE